MGKFFLWLIGIVVSVVVYGYWDAYSQSKVDVALSARVITPWQLYVDSYADYEPVDNGQLFIAVRWEQPSNNKRVSGIYITGRVFDGAELVTNAAAPCQRVGSTWLGRGEWGAGNSDLICFIKINKKLMPTVANSRINMDEAKARIANMTINYIAEVKAVNKPMRYVIWLNEQVSTIYNAISAPFQRA